MKTILIIWFFNAGELALTSEVIDGPPSACEVVKELILTELNAHKTLRGINRGAYGFCTPLLR